ncbi:MAG TPA: cobalamin biosynthesis protein [Aestuariivirgaceae bacterium]|nr:cobalamin biosynthesis protein [Aestuariivirgaceae bacterium]
MWRDAARHVSPNAGWPEAAMAGALAIRLGGPRSYDGSMLDLAWLGTGRQELDQDNNLGALRLYRLTLNLVIMLIGVAVLVWLAPDLTVASIKITAATSTGGPDRRISPESPFRL